MLPERAICGEDAGVGGVDYGVGLVGIKSRG